MNLKTASGLLLAVILALSAGWCSAAPIQVPFGSVPVQVTQVGSGQTGAAAGSEFKFSGFDTSQFTELYFGLNPNSPPKVIFNGVSTTLSFASALGTIATWLGTAQPDLGSGIVTVPLRLTFDVSGLGANPWIVDLNSVSLPMAMGAAVSDPTGADFDVHLHIQADYGAGFVPLVPAPFTAGGSVGSIVGSAFYVVRPVPEPGAAVSLALGALLQAACRGWHREAR